MRNVGLWGMICTGTLCVSAQGWQMPMMPPYLRTVEERAVYLAGHYWDSLDWSDSEVANDTASIERVYADFCELLPVLSPEGRKEAVGKALSTVASGNAGGYGVMMDLAGKYLWQTDSPVYSEESYRPFVEYGLRVNPDDEVLKSRLEELSTNVIGSKGADMELVSLSASEGFPKGNEGRDPESTAGHIKGDTTLYQTLVPEGETLVLFYSPGCRDCRELMERLATDAEIGLKINRGELGVTAIYAGDEAGAWRRDAERWPRDQWRIFMTADPEEEAYNIRRTPTIYLLDKDGTVLLRNATTRELFMHLE